MLLAVFLGSQAHAFLLPKEQIETYLFRFELEGAKKLSLQLTNEGHKQFYVAHSQMYKYFATQDPKLANEIRKNWNTYTAAVSKLPDSEKDIYLSELHGKRAIMEFLERKYVTASRFGRNSFNLVNSYKKKYPNSAESLKMQGLFNVVLGNVPRRYQWIANLLGFKGDLKKGLRQLENAGKYSKILRHEAQLILCTIEKSMLDRPQEAIVRLEKARAKYGKNILLDYLYASGLLRLKKNEEALVVLNRSQLYDFNKVQFIPFWDFLHGKACYYKNDLSGAQKHLALFVRGYKGKLMRTDAYFRLGMALTLKKRYDLGKPFFELIAKEEHGGFDEDEYAQYMAKKFSEKEPDAITLSLFQARNYFDGGYYSKSSAILRQLKIFLPKDSKHRTELNYRFARIYHSLGKLDQASTYYNASIEANGADKDVYLKAYASYFLGEIAREKGERQTAKSKYEKALTYENYFYQSGLENRCKAALTNLK